MGTVQHNVMVRNRPVTFVVTELDGCEGIDAVDEAGRVIGYLAFDVDARGWAHVDMVRVYADGDHRRFVQGNQIRRNEWEQLTAPAQGQGIGAAFYWMLLKIVAERGGQGVMQSTSLLAGGIGLWASFASRGVSCLVNERRAIRVSAIDQIAATLPLVADFSTVAQ